MELPVGIALYAVWFACSDHLKRTVPDSLPAWPCWIIFWPLWMVLRLLGITQRTEFSSKLDPTRRYIFCCGPHGAYAFSGATWIGPQFRLALLPEYAGISPFYGVASALFFIPVVREVLLLIGCREVSTPLQSTLARFAMDATLAHVASEIRPCRHAIDVGKPE